MAVFLSVAEFSTSVGVSPSTTRRWLLAGMPHHVGPNGHLMVEEREALCWLDEFDEEEAGEEEDDEYDDEELECD